MGGANTQTQQPETKEITTIPDGTEIPYQQNAYDNFYAKKHNANDQEMLMNLARKLAQSAKNTFSQNFTGREVSPPATQESENK